MKLRKLQLHRKKGFWLDIPYIIVILFAIILVVIFVHKAYTEIAPAIIDNVNNTATTTALNTGQSVIEGFDILIIMVLVGLAIALIASVFLLDTHPLFFVLILFMLVAMMAVGFILTHAFQTISTEPDVAGSFDKFPLTSYVISNFSIFILFLIIVGVIAFYAKTRIG